MSTRPHWANCISHFDEEVRTFAREYFGRSERRCLLVAAAGFDPRSRHIGGLLANEMGDRLQAVFVREERGRPDAALQSAANENERLLRALVPASRVVPIEVFSDDEAPVGGNRIANLLEGLEIAEDVTDVVLDLTALSIGIGFPAAKLLLAKCEADPKRSFHIMIASNPELDDRIASEPGDRPMAVRGFKGTEHLTGIDRIAKVWIPQLAKGRGPALDVIGASVGNCYKICPVLPFPARDPRRADALLAEHRARLTDEWEVDPRDIVYVSERNPLDCYRTLSTLKDRYDRTVEGVFQPQMILSPIGSKVMAVGALMAAIEHGLTVQYLETVRYDFDPATAAEEGPPELIVHLLLSGPAYGDYGRSNAAADG